MGAPRFYVLARLLWDTKSDVDTLTNRYMRLSFGEAVAPAVCVYFDRGEGHPTQHRTRLALGVTVE